MKLNGNDILIQRWRAAFLAANRKCAPSVAYENGWFNVGGSRYRRAQFDAMKNELLRRKAEEKGK